MSFLHGPILTSCYTLDQVADCIKRGGYNALKVVTGWGAPGDGWNAERMTRVARMVERLVVRTVAGDPSYNNGSHAFPLAQQVVQEIAPWYRVRADILIEIGNEPNLPGWSEDSCWDYRWHLQEAITQCRAQFPKAKLISPAPMLAANTNPRRWIEIAADQLHRCDYIGIHVYEFDAWLREEQRKGSTAQLETMRQLYTPRFFDKPWLMTEYGINDVETAPIVKGRRAAAMVRRQRSTPVLPTQVQGALYYHFCATGDHQPEYHLWPLGDDGYKQAWEGR